MPRTKSIATNPIIDQLKGAGPSTKLTGFIGRATAGRIELYSDLQTVSRIELAEADVLHVVDGEKPTEPSLLFVRTDAAISVRHETTVKELAAMGDEETCHCDPADDDMAGSVAALISNGGFTLGTSNCKKNKSCKDKCAKKDPFVRQGCMDSCDVAHPCKKIGGFDGTGGIFIL